MHPNRADTKKKQRSVNSVPSETQEKIQNNLVHMENIRVKFGKVVALDGVEFSVGRNEIVGLLGDNGAGKTTLVKTLSACQQQTTGEIYLDGELVRFRDPREARLAGIETGFQNQALVDHMSITRNFFLGRELYRRIGPFRILDNAKMNDVTVSQLKKVGFQGNINTRQRVTVLSGGERQAIVIARALHFGTKLLILDEPTIALSEEKIQLVLSLVKAAKKTGLSVVFITHKAEEVFQVADRFVVLMNGKVYANFRKKDTNLKELEKLFIYSRLTAMRELAASMAHQIKNPLAVMNVSIQMLRDDYRVIDKKNSYDTLVRMLISEVEALDHVVNNFLDFARPLRFQEALFPVEPVVRSALRSLPLQSHSTVTIDFAMPDDSIEYVMDKNLMQHAVANLVMNAVEASSPGASVSIAALLENDKLCIEVCDQGCGIDESTKKQIFNFFFTTKMSGAGLGLPIVRRIVEQHHGDVTVDSQPGKGSTFRIVI